MKIDLCDLDKFLTDSNFWSRIKLSHCLWLISTDFESFYLYDFQFCLLGFQLWYLFHVVKEPILWNFFIWFQNSSNFKKKIQLTEIFSTAFKISKWFQLTSNCFQLSVKWIQLSNVFKSFQLTSIFFLIVFQFWYFVLWRKPFFENFHLIFQTGFWFSINFEMFSIDIKMVLIDIRMHSTEFEIAFKWLSSVFVFSTAINVKYNCVLTSLVNQQRYQTDFSSIVENLVLRFLMWFLYLTSNSFPSPPLPSRVSLLLSVLIRIDFFF